MSSSVYSLLQTINRVKEVVPQEDGQYLECYLACIETFFYILFVFRLYLKKEIKPRIRGSNSILYAVHKAMTSHCLVVNTHHCLLILFPYILNIRELVIGQIPCLIDTFLLWRVHLQEKSGAPGQDFSLSLACYKHKMVAKY